MHDVNPIDFSRIAQDLQIRKVQVESVVKLLEEGNTIPFILRYRKERTGGLNEEVLRQIQLRANLQRQLADRKKTILRSIENQGKLTEHLRRAILKADTARRLEDLYLPFKPKKKSTATAARECGLEPLALAVWNRDPAAANLEEVLPGAVNPDKGLNSADEVRAGVLQILAEMINETAEVRAAVRFILWESGLLTSTKTDRPGAEKGSVYKDYFKFSEPVRKIPPHRILALNRGEREGILKVKLEWDAEKARQRALEALAEACQRHAATGATPSPSLHPAAPHEAASAPAAPEPAATGPSAGQVDPGNIATPPATLPSEPVPITSPDQTLPPAGISDPVATDQPPAPPLPTAPPEGSATASESPPSAEMQAAAPPAETATPPEPITAACADTSERSAAVVAPPTETVGTATALPGAVEFAGLAPLAPVSEGEPLSPGTEFRTPHATLLRQALDDAMNRQLQPALEREIWRELMDEAEAHAIHVFACNLRGLLLQRPLRNRRILAIDPGFRTGCRIAALDEHGILLDQATIFPNAGKKKDRGKGDRYKGKPPAGNQEPASATAAVAAPAAEALAAATPETVAQPSAVPNEQAQPSGPEAVPTDVMVSALPGNTAAPTDAESPTTPTTDVTVAEAPAAAAEVPTAPAAANVEAVAEGPDRRAEARAAVEDMVRKYSLSVVALGNGPACRETEEFLSEIIAGGLNELEYVIVNEAGVSYYSASPLGKEEFPGFDPTLRGTISIGRRLQDPLTELVKVDPAHLSVGLYQHDVDPKRLKEALEAVVESCVNQVGADLNSAGVPLLRHIAGLNPLAARDLVDHRKTHGPFRSREQLTQMSSVGQERSVQAAGFLRIPDGEQALDTTWIHPESYELTRKILEQVGCTPELLKDASRREELQAKVKALSPVELANNLQAGEPTVRDILAFLLDPGHDPREDQPLPIFRKGVLKLEDLQPGMELRGTVLNVVDFGAFVDIGLKDSGLVHISQLANRFIKNPHEVVSVGDVVTAWVLKVDQDKHHVSLTLIRPGTEKKPRERRPAPAEGTGAPAQGERPPRRGGPGRGRPGGPPPGGRAPSASPPRQGQGQQPGPGPRARPGAEAAGSPPARRSEGPGPNAPGARQPPSRPLPPRKPRREPPKPKLSKEALEGKEDLRSFGELSAFFAARNRRPPTPDDRKKEGHGGGKHHEPEQPPPPAAPSVETAAGPPTESGLVGSPEQTNPATPDAAPANHAAPVPLPRVEPVTEPPAEPAAQVNDNSRAEPQAPEKKEDVPANSAP
jgi:uncharacterized protein